MILTRKKKNDQLQGLGRKRGHRSLGYLALFVLKEKKIKEKFTPVSTIALKLHFRERRWLTGPKISLIARIFNGRED